MQRDRPLGRRGRACRWTSRSGGELAVALHAGFPAERIAFHGNNKSVDELTAAVKAGVGHVVLDSMTEIDRLDTIAGRRRRGAGRPGPRHRRRRGAHPRVHRHRPRGPEVRPVAGQRRGHGRRCAGSSPPTTCGWSACTATSDRRSSTSTGSSWPRTGSSACCATWSPSSGWTRRPRSAPSTSAAAWASPMCPKMIRRRSQELAAKLGAIVRNESAAVGLPAPRLVGRARPRHRRTRHRHALRGGHRQGRGDQRRRLAALHQRRRRHERQHPHLAVRRASTTVRLVSRGSDAPPTLARIVGKHCESGDIVVRDAWVPGDVAARRPVGGGRHRRLLLFDVEPVQPDRPPRRGGRARRAGPPDPAPGDRRRSAESGSEVANAVHPRRRPEPRSRDRRRGIGAGQRRQRGRPHHRGQRRPTWPPASERRWSCAASAVRRVADDRGVPVAMLTDNVEELVSREDVDIVVELMGPVEPARKAILTALEHGKSVVTANKALLAQSTGELAQAAERAHVDLYFEAAVAGAIPVIRPLTQSLAGDSVLRVARHRQRHHQLHPVRNGLDRSRLRRGPGRRQRAGLRRGRPHRRRRGLRRRRQGGHPGLDRLPHPRHRRRRLPRGHHQGQPGRLRGRQGARLHHQAALDLRAHHHTRWAATGFGPCLPGAGSADPPAGDGQRRVQRRGGRGRGGRPADVLRPGRRRRADRVVGHG